MVKILMAVDGSKHALSATRKLVRHAAWFKEPPQVELVTVQARIPRVTGLSRTVLTQATVDRHYREEGARALAASKRLLDKARLRCTGRVLVGDVAATIVDHAEREGCDMIYMGSRGLTALSGVVLGSVAMRVLHLARLPVTLVK